jgi:hypothetical protein
MNRNYETREVVKSTAQAFTTSWVDIGGEIEMRGYNTLAVWATLDINNTNNPRIRALAKLDSAGTKEYNIVIKSVGASDVKIESNYIEWNVDADMETLIQFETDGLIPYIQLQIQCGTVGVAAGQIDYLEITKAWK